MSTGEGAAGIVAAEKPIPPKPTTFIDKIWNNDTKLAGKDSAIPEYLLETNPRMSSYCLILDTGTTASVRKLSLFSIF